MTTIEKEVLTMGKMTKKPTQTNEEFLNGYKEYKLKKAKLHEKVKGRADTRVQA